MEIKFIASPFITSDNKIDWNKIKVFAGECGGVCWSPTGFTKGESENDERKIKRADDNLKRGHHSVFDQVYIPMRLKGISRNLAMHINNEKQYSATEQSFRYTEPEEFLSETDQKMYYKWKQRFSEIAERDYSDVFSKRDIRGFGSENARVFLGLNTKTSEGYTTSIRQLNYLAMMLAEELKNPSSEATKIILPEIKEFLSRLESQGALDNNLMKNNKQRRMSLYRGVLGKNEQFGNSFSMQLNCSNAALAEIQRHRSMSCRIVRPNGYYTSKPIIDNPEYHEEYDQDMKFMTDQHICLGSTNDIVIDGELEAFTDSFLKERLCRYALLEVEDTAKLMLSKYMDGTKETEPAIHEELKQYSHGSRCLSKRFHCPDSCGWDLAIKGERRV